MSALVMQSSGRSSRTILIRDDLLFVQNFEMICRLAKIDPERILFVIDGKVHRYAKRPR